MLLHAIDMATYVIYIIWLVVLYKYKPLLEHTHTPRYISNSFITFSANWPLYPNAHYSRRSTRQSRQIKSESHNKTLLFGFLIKKRALCWAFTIVL